MRRREGFSDAAVARARRWALRAGLVVAAGAAGLAVSAGSAQADTGLDGTLDHVVGTVSKATGGSHGSAKAAKPQASKHATASPVRTQARRSPVAVVHSTTRTVVRTTRPVVKAARPVVKPVAKTARTVTKVAKPVVRQDPPRRATKPSTKPVAKPAVKPSTKTADKRPGSAERALVDLRVDLPTAAVSTVSLAGLEVAVRVPPSLDLAVGLAPDVVGVELGLGTSGPVASVGLPSLPGLGLPGVDFPGVDMPGTVMPGAPAIVPALSGPPAAHAEALGTPTSATDLGAVARAAAAPVAVLQPAATGRAVGATASRSAASADEQQTAPVSGLPGAPTQAPALDLSVAPVGAATGGAAHGALLLGVAVAAALTVDRTAVARALAALVTEASRLVHQPGFAPD